MAKKKTNVPKPRRTVKEKPQPSTPPPEAATDDLEELDAENQLEDQAPGDDIPEAEDTSSCPAEEAHAAESDDPIGGTQIELEEAPDGSKARSTASPAPAGGTFADTPGGGGDLTPPPPATEEAPPIVFGTPDEPTSAPTPLSGDKAWMAKTATHLGVLADYGELPVVEFRPLADLGEPHAPQEAKRVLDSFVEQGLVQTMWKASKNRYSLTPLGESTVKKMRA